MDSGGSAGTTPVAGTVIGDVVVADDSPFVDLAAAVDGVLESGLAPAAGNDAAGVLKAIERQERRLYAAGIEAMDQIDRRGLHHTDGHGNVKVQVRHVAKLSNAEAHARLQVMRMFRHLPKLKAALWDGEIGIDQTQLLARVFSNPRVRGAMELRQDKFIDQARKLPYVVFERKVREWERLIDEDGAPPKNEVTHENRTVRFTQSPIDLDWELVGKFSAMQGLEFSEVLEHYVQAEWDADWQKVVAEHGDNASVDLMPRTDAQRRADALIQMARDAAGADGSAVPPGFTHIVVWNADTFEEMLRRIAGADPRPLDPDTFRCESINGVPLDPNEAAANAMLHSFRRMVVNAESLTIDAGTKRRFTGILRDVVRVQSEPMCVWPGCHVPVSRCETDHITPHRSGGRTNPDDGVPACGKHNRWKEKGYTIRRWPDGTWTTTRPDGTPIDP